MLADNVTLPTDRADYHRLALRSPLPALAEMLVTFLSADVRFIGLDFADQLLECFILHRGANARAHIPRGFIRAGTNLPVNL